MLSTELEWYSFYELHYELHRYIVTVSKNGMYVPGKKEGEI